MVISNVKILKLTNTETKLVGKADITIDEMIVVHGIKILSNEGKMFFAMPSCSTNKGFKDIVHPISSDVRNMFEKIIFGLYKVVLDSDNDCIEFENMNYSINCLLEQDIRDFGIQMRFNI